MGEKFPCKIYRVDWSQDLVPDGKEGERTRQLVKVQWNNTETEYLHSQSLFLLNNRSFLFIFVFVCVHIYKNTTVIIQSPFHCFSRVLLMFHSPLDVISRSDQLHWPISPNPINCFLSLHAHRPTVSLSGYCILLYLLSKVWFCPTTKLGWRHKVEAYFFLICVLQKRGFYKLRLNTILTVNGRKKNLHFTFDKVLE